MILLNPAIEGRSGHINTNQYFDTTLLYKSDYSWIQTHQQIGLAVRKDHPVRSQVMHIVGDAITHSRSG